MTGNARAIMNNSQMHNRRALAFTDESEDQLQDAQRDTQWNKMEDGVGVHKNDLRHMLNHSKSP